MTFIERNIKPIMTKEYEGVSESDYPMLYSGEVMYYFNSKGSRIHCRFHYNEVNHSLRIENVFKLVCSPAFKQKTSRTFDMTRFERIEDPDSTKNVRFTLVFQDGKVNIQARNMKQKTAWLREIRLLSTNIDAFVDGSQEVKQIFSLFTENIENGLSANEFQTFLEGQDVEESELESTTKNLFDNKSHINFREFLRFLNSEHGDVIKHTYLQKFQDMTQPLSDYYIYSSHNTYLVHDQLFGPSSCAAYKYALLKGCRCVELDLWNGDNGTPIIYHGYTLTSKINAKDVLQTIKDYAFKVSSYPLIISTENHLNLEQQKVFAQYCKEIFGNRLFIEADLTQAPSPEAMKNRFIIKGKKLKKKETANFDDNDEDDDDLVEDEAADIPKIKEMEENKSTTKAPVTISQEFSDLISILIPCKLKSPMESLGKYTSVNVASVDENKLSAIMESEPGHMVRLTDQHMVRVYPAGKRVKSSNYNPVLSWASGSQIVALNTQTPSLPMHLNEGHFRLNGQTGYILKPEELRVRNKGTTFNPLDTENCKKLKLKVKIISGHNLYIDSSKSETKGEKLARYVNVSIINPLNKEKQKSKIIEENGFNPSWNQTFEFTIDAVKFAHICFHVKKGAGIKDKIDDIWEAVSSCKKLQDVKRMIYQEPSDEKAIVDYDEVIKGIAKSGNADLVGQFACPVWAIGSGYRFIHLRDDLGREISEAKLFVHISKKEA